MSTSEQYPALYWDDSQEVITLDRGYVSHTVHEPTGHIYASSNPGRKIAHRPPADRRLPCGHLNTAYLTVTRQDRVYVLYKIHTTLHIKVHMRYSYSRRLFLPARAAHLLSSFRMSRAKTYSLATGTLVAPPTSRRITTSKKRVHAPRYVDGITRSGTSGALCGCPADGHISRALDSAGSS